MSEPDLEDEKLRPQFSIKISQDKRKAEIRVNPGGSDLFIFAADSSSIDELISQLGSVRHQLSPAIPTDIEFNPPKHLSAYDPAWRLLPDSSNEYATFWIRHPGYGWSGYGFPRHEARNISKWFRKVTSATLTPHEQSPTASSFGGENFLVTTDGLGFYYYGKGETRIGPNPFEQIEFDSDRAAGIVAGSIAERRLEQAIQSRLKSDKPDIVRNIFRPSGALGPFSTKIDMAYLMGLLSEEAHKDLSNLKSIRNDFAHALDLDSFDVASIKDRCKNFCLVDRHVGPVPARHDFPALEDHPSPFWGLPDYEEKLADPRFRYVMTAQLISNALGESADHPDRVLPYV